MDWDAANPLFIQPPDANYDREKSYVPPIYFEEGVRERLQNPTAAEFFKKASAVNQAGAIGLQYEGFNPKAYWDKDHYSIGYGTQSIKGESIDEPEARKRMKQAYEERHSMMLNKYKGYREANPNIQGGILDTVYNIKSIEKYPNINRYLKSTETMPYAIQELPSFRRADGEIKNGLERRRADDFRLATTKEDIKYLPVFMKR